MPLTTRVIARLDIKSPNVVKGRRFDGLRIMGKPGELARLVDADGADEVLYVDIVASLYGRGLDGETLEAVAADLTIPLTVAGGIRSVFDVRTAMRLGADKIGVNTAAVNDPLLIAPLSKAYGCQALVVSIEAKQRQGWWEVYTHGGREATGLDAVKWAADSVEAGAGEILLTSVDRDGTGQGADLELIRSVRQAAPDVPLIASGGMGKPEHCLEALESGADAVAIASLLYSNWGLPGVKEFLYNKGVDIRR